MTISCAAAMTASASPSRRGLGVAAGFPGLRGDVSTATSACAVLFAISRVADMGFSFLVSIY
jgi:hypothetical protein